jgi:hypothetical protein
MLLRVVWQKFRGVSGVLTASIIMAIYKIILKRLKRETAYFLSEPLEMIVAAPVIRISC